MQVKIEKLAKSLVKILVEVSQEETQKYYDKATKDIAAVVKVDGFRQGHAPLDMVEKHVSKEKIEAHMLDLALPIFYADAVKENNIKAVSRPKINILTLGPLTFEAEVAVYPEVKVTGYAKIKIAKNPTEVTDKDVEAILNEIKQGRATFTEVERAAKEGDKVEFDFDGYDDGGAPLENTSSKNHALVIGSKTMVPGFEENLIGLKKGDEKEFKVEFPKDYFHKPFQSKKVNFKVKIHTVSEASTPEFTPEFIKQITGKDETLEDLKKNIRLNLADDKKHQEVVRRENEFLSKIVELTKVELPESLVEEEIDSMLEEFTQELQGRGLDLQRYLETTKKELKDLRDNYKKEAEKRLTLRFGLNQIFEQEKLETTEEELKAEIEKVIGMYPEAERVKVKSEYTENSYMYLRLKNKLKMDKLFDRFLVE